MNYYILLHISAQQWTKKVQTRHFVHIIRISQRGDKNKAASFKKNPIRSIINSILYFYSTFSISQSCAAQVASSVKHAGPPVKHKVATALHRQE